MSGRYLLTITAWSYFLLTAWLPASPGAKIQVALLLDTSNSMDGLIDQAKSQLWKVVNEFAMARQNGQTPVLEIALYEYGNDNLARNEGYIRQVTPLTRDLDLISEKLFGLTTNGGSEYCGAVIKSAVDELKWDGDPGVLKVIFIAGNEPFSQGGVDYRSACREAIGRSIIVNTIFCGNLEKGIRIHWKEGADLADGKYMNIDQNEAVVHIEAPQDEEINRLNDALNKTYLPYGGAGESYKNRQTEQDMNAAAYGAANISQRAISKTSANYKNTAWDLVDAVEEGSINLEETAAEELPEVMQEMSLPERRAYIAEQRARRQEIQEKIRRLSEERRKFIASRHRQNSDTHTLDQAIIEAVRVQAAKKNFEFK